MATETNQGQKDIVSPTMGRYEVKYIYIIDPNTNQLVDVRVEYIFS